MSDEEHKCHCPHVVVILHDFKRIEKVAWILIVGILAVLGKEAWATMTSHIRDEAPVGRSGERMFPDRADEPK